MIALHVLRYSVSVYGLFYAAFLTAQFGSALACPTRPSALRRLRKGLRTTVYGAPMFAVSVISWALYKEFVSSVVATAEGVLFVAVPTALLSALLRGLRPVARYTRRVCSPRLVSVAAAIAGERRDLRGPWLADLAGDPASGNVLTERQRGRMAAGFLIAALRMRATDMARPLWQRVDWVLSSESRTNSVITAAAGALAVYFARTDGVHAVLTQDWQSCAGLGGGLFILARWLRKIRGIELAERERRRDRAN